MGILQYTLKNMIGGVSKQPPSIRLENQCEEMVNCIPSAIDFLKRRTGTHNIAKLLDTLPDNAFVDFILRGENDTGLLIIYEGVAHVYTLTGVLLGQVSSPYFNSENPSQYLKLLTINDYNFIVNTKTIVAKKLSKGVPPINNSGFIWTKQVVFNSDYSMEINGIFMTSTPGSLVDTRLLMALLDDYIEKYPEIKEIPRTLEGSILRFDAPNITIKVFDDADGAYLKYFRNSTQYFNELPTHAPNNWYMEITGDPTSQYDNYYVQFVSDDGKNIGTGYWKEVYKQGDDCVLEETTMPIAITIGDTINLESISWEPRKAGDKLTCPEPSFIGKTINDISYYHNRLCFLTDDGICMSEAGKYFNFFNTTATALLDSDPIDVAYSGTKVTKLKYMVPFNEGLLIYSDRTLYNVDHGDILSTASISLKPLIQFDASLCVRPYTIDASIIYATNSGNNTLVREYNARTDKDLYGYENELTSHVQNYISKGIKKIIACQDENIVFFIGSSNKIYVYNYKRSDTYEKLQSAWGRWTFSGDIISAEVVKNTLYLVVKYDDGIYLENLDVSSIDNNYIDRESLTDKTIDYVSKYTYSTQYIRFEDNAPTVTGGRTQIRTLTIRYADTEGFKVVIERKGRNIETIIVNCSGSGEKRFFISSKNEDVKISIESFEDKPFKIVESRFEALFASRSKIL